MALSCRGFSSVSAKNSDYVSKRGKNWDAENIAKLIVDSLSRITIEKDGDLPEFEHMALFPDDTVEFVAMIQIIGTEAAEDTAWIEVFRERVTS